MLVKKRGWIVISVVITVMVFEMIIPVSVHAHRLVVEHDQQKGEIHVRYDDGSRSSTAVIIAYAPNGHVVLEGSVNGEGLLVYDREISIDRIIAEDGMGHRAGWVTGEQDEWLLIPVWLRALLGISILLLIAAIFYYRSNTNKKEG